MKFNDHAIAVILGLVIAIAITAITPAKRIPAPDPTGAHSALTLSTLWQQPAQPFHSECGSVSFEGRSLKVCIFTDRPVELSHVDITDEGPAEQRPQ